MFGVLEFTAKAVFGKDFPNPYLSTNLGAVRIVQGKLDLSCVVLFYKRLFQGFKLDAVAGEVCDYTRVLLPVLDEHPFKADFLADEPPSFQHHAGNMPTLALVFQPDPGLVPDEFGHVLGV